ncbi:MAG: gspD2, partial [Deltaproteobacteria bacterium]|nr:gspD2 [Deltaproteobacteria bacterium]
MKRIGWLFCAVALSAANVIVAEEGPPPISPLEMADPSHPGAPPAGDARSADPSPPIPSVPPMPAPATAPPTMPPMPAPATAPPTMPPMPAPATAPPPAPPMPSRATAPPSAPPMPSRTAAPPSAPPIPEAAAAPAPAVSPFRPPPPAPSGAGPGFFVKFNNADIYEVIHTLGRTAGINYLIDPRVRGVVNVHTQGVVRKEGALDLLFAILRVNGATAIKEGDTYHIVPMIEAKMEPLRPVFPGDNTAKGASNQVIMRAFPLQYIAVGEMAKVIKPFLSAGGEAVEVARANILLVTDTSANLEKTA